MEEKLFQLIGSNLDATEKNQMFGKSCFKINDKAFICFFQNSMVFKLPEEERALALNLKGAQLFDPSGKGRPMKAWVQIPYTHSGKWETFAKIAFNYVKH